MENEEGKEEEEIFKLQSWVSHSHYSQNNLEVIIKYISDSKALNSFVNIIRLPYGV